MIILLAGNQCCPTRRIGSVPSFSNMQWFRWTGEWGASFVALIVILFAFEVLSSPTIFLCREQRIFLRLHNVKRHLAITPRTPAWLSPVRLSPPIWQLKT